MTAREAIRSALSLLTSRDRRLLGLSVTIQMATALLDLVGVLLIGLVGALSVATLQSQPPPTVVTELVERVGLDHVSSQDLVMLAAGAAAVVLLTKSIVSSYLTRRVFVFLANRQALVTGRIVQALLASPLTVLQKRSSQEMVFALVTGAGAATMSVLGLSVIAATELALLLVLAVALIFISPWVAIGSILFFAIVAFGLQRAMGNWAGRVGSTAAAADIESMHAIQEALSVYREISVANRRALYVNRIQGLRWKAAKVAADTMFIGMFPKYMFEAALVVGGFVLAAVLFSTQDSLTAVGTFALFLAAGTRVMPSLLRLQGSFLGLRGAAGVAGPTFELADELLHPNSSKSAEGSDIAAITQAIVVKQHEFDASVTMRNVTFTYPGAKEPAIQGVSLSIKAGQSVALVGRSGAGKSTLADLVLGVLSPDTGEVLVGGQTPLEAIQCWPGGMAYVPQDVVLSNGTIRSNVALGLPRDAISDDLVWEALRGASLADYLFTSRDGLDTHVGEGGVRLSGGQRQRLGIARALYTRPSLLVLDEATSALDAETERAITSMIDGLGGHVTTLIIAHRLSTVRNAQKIVYLDRGRVEAEGSFDEVCETVPAMKRQADLMGLA